MIAGTQLGDLTLDERISALVATKLRHTQEKQRIIGSMDHDDWALILPPQDRRKVVQSISGSGMPITDVLLDGVQIVSNHPNGGFYGPKACGSNFRRLLEAHPPYVDPNSSLAGGYCANFSSYRRGGWRPEFNFDHLRPVIDRYQLICGIGAGQHFCQDLAIGLKLGWGGIMENIRRRRPMHPEAAEFYDGLHDVVLGMQTWIGNTAAAARRLAELQSHPDYSPSAWAQLRPNLLELAEMNERLVNEPPRSFREACQWMLWHLMAARMYNGSGSLGRLDVLLTPYYEREHAAGTLSDDEAAFHIACLLLRDTSYIQLGGPDASGKDVTNRLSYLVLEAAHKLKIPANIGVAVGEHVDPGLMRRGVEIMFADRTGIPKFLAVENTARGFTRLGYPIALGYERAYSGCHWVAIPGREYTVNDCVKINFGPVFDVALRDMLSDGKAKPSMRTLWNRFTKHLAAAVKGIATCLDFHLTHMQHVMPELVMDLLCYGPIEKGLDASAGGVEFYNLCCDGAALATAADSFAAAEQRVEKEQRLSWAELLAHLDADWAGDESEQARLMMRSVNRFGSGGSRADYWAVKVAKLFAELVAGATIREGVKMVPGLFSWAQTIVFGKNLGATPNGRRKGAPISHGPNPEPGFRRDGAASALAVAVAAVQSGYGNTAPMQIELDPGLVRDQQGVDNVCSLIRTHFELGGTQINMNIMDKAKVLAAHEDPSKFPDLVVRVTGFSAYFASLSKEFRQLVVDRIIQEN